jgi:hypothetical protein
MRIFAAPLIIFSPQVNLTTAITASPLQAGAMSGSVRVGYATPKAMRAAVVTV